MAVVKGEQYGLAHQRNYLAYTWVLKDFRKIVFENERPGSAIRSQIFEPGKESVAQIYLMLFPGGDFQECAKYVSVYVAVDRGAPLRKVQFERLTLTMKTSDGKVIHRHNGSFRIMDLGSEVDYEAFIQRKELLQQLPDDDVLVISLEMTYSMTIVKTRSGAVKDVPQRYPIVLADEVFLSAVDNGRHSDVRIVVHEAEIPAHRFVLAARSKVFSAMFDHEFLENSSGRIEITDFDVSTVRSMLSFMYSGIVRNLDIALALELLRAADKYDIADLKSLCSNFLISHMDEENVLKVLVGAFVHNAEQLFKEGIDYLCDKNNSVNFEKYESMLSDHPKLLVKLLAQMRKKFCCVFT